MQGPRSPRRRPASVPSPAPSVEVLFELPAPVLEPAAPLDPSWKEPGLVRPPIWLYGKFNSFILDSMFGACADLGIGLGVVLGVVLFFFLYFINF